jgi:ABC-2 type transport system ATP-binding protein
VLHGAGVTVVEAGGEALEVDGAKSEHIGELAAQHQIVLHELSPQQASLEEAFMQLTAESVEYHAHADPGLTGNVPPAVPPAAPPAGQRQAPQWGNDWKKG